MPATVGKFAADKSGVTAIEYVLIAGGIALAIIVSVGLLGGELGVLFGDLQVSLAGM
ncbi:MAG: Flp family type IVb pilin [Proteobacteria bacterium]|nr:Flp family type IVb pilin [Pseudomonadota bacterium]